VPRGDRVHTGLASWHCRHVPAEPHVYLYAGNISLALQAYNSNQVSSLRAVASTYDVPLTTLRERRTGILPRAIAPANLRKFTLEEEQIIL
jgi:hypothetical protein